MKKMKQTLAQFAGIALILVLVFGASLATIQALHNAWQEMREDDAYRHFLVTESKRSEAHRFVVWNWMQCKPLFTTPATCYAGIRGAAAARGEAFVQSVDAAAKSMKLI